MDMIEKVLVCCDGGEHVDVLREIPKVLYVRTPFSGYIHSPKKLFQSFKVMKKAVKDYEIDIIHVHSQHVLPMAHGIKLQLGIPYLWTNHIDSIPSPKIFKIMCGIMRFPVISVSQEMRNMMIQYFGCKPQRCYVVNNGTDLDLLQPLSDAERCALEEELSINRLITPYVICLLSRMTPVKGHMQLLQAVNQLEEKDRIKIIFAGHTYPQDEAYRRELISFCRDNQIDTEFLDFSSPRDIYGISDLFVLPSFHEGFPITIIEALSMECAVIRSRTPGWQEMEPWTEIVEKNDVAGLAAMIHQVIASGFNREKTLAGQKAVKELFSKERCADSTVRVYQQILQHG